MQFALELNNLAKYLLYFFFIYFTFYFTLL